MWKRYYSRSRAVRNASVAAAPANRRVIHRAMYS